MREITETNERQSQPKTTTKKKIKQTHHKNKIKMRQQKIVKHSPHQRNLNSA